MQTGRKGRQGTARQHPPGWLLVHGIRDTKIDAIFGDGTEEGVREFQKRFDIGVDGIAGPETFEKLLL